MRTYKGYIYKKDVEEYGLPSGQVEMCLIGAWVSNGREIGSYMFADETIQEKLGHEYQFSKDRHNTFCLKL